MCAYAPPSKNMLTLKSLRRKKRKADPVAGLKEWLETIDFEHIRTAAASLGDSDDPFAIEPLVELVKKSSALRAAALGALKKLAQDNDKAAAELSIATLEEKPEDPGGEWGVRMLPQAGRRRSSRVLMEVPVLVNWLDKTGEKRTDFCTTRIVNAHGALITLKAPLPHGAQLELINVKTKGVAAAKVIWTGKSGDGGGVEVGIELDAPDQSFWVGRTPD